MKKLMVWLLALTLCLSFCACGAKEQAGEEQHEPAAGSTEPAQEPAQEPVQEPTKETTQTEPVQTEETGKVVSPYPTYLNMENLDNCTFAASFEAGDVYLNGDGALVVSLTVYDYERFDTVDILGLTAGDKLLINGGELLVTSAEDGGNGLVRINGGPEAGGCTLAGDDGGAYCEVGENAQKNYHAVGEITLPVSQDFLLKDAADPEAPERVLYPGDFLMEMEAGEGDLSYTPQHTRVTVESSKIILIERGARA